MRFYGCIVYALLCQNNRINILKFKARFQDIIGTLHKAYSLEPDPRKKQELLENIEDAILGSHSLDDHLDGFMALQDMEDVLTSWKPGVGHKK